MSFEKTLDLEIIDFEFRHHRIRLGEIITISKPQRHAMRGRSRTSHELRRSESKKRRKLDRAEE